LKPDLTPGIIIENMVEIITELSEKNDEYVNLSKDRAGIERDYNLAVAKKTLELKNLGYPIGIIKEVVKGEKVAELKFSLDVAVTVENACLQAIKDLRSACDVYRSILAWKKAEMTAQ